MSCHECYKLKKELNRFEVAYDILNSEHSMMLRELGLNPENKPTVEIIRNAIVSNVKIINTDCDCQIINGARIQGNNCSVFHGSAESVQKASEVKE